MSQPTEVASRSRVLSGDAAQTLAWLPATALDIDLDDPAQRRFGDYELLARIGEGGMGVVFRARQHGLERDVAIKLLAAGPAASPDFVERFRREARSAARMQHPNIVEIFEFGHREGLDFFTMRLIEGPNLADRMRSEGPMPPRDAARLLRTLAEAVDYAHRLGVLHLDLKPANVLLGAAGVPMIADFGLARAIDAEHVAGEVSGTPSYMAPEQARGEIASAATDLYGLGAILYECLAGKPPFAGGDAQAVLERVVAEAPVPLRAVRREVPVDLEAICLKCLAKDPAQRYPSARTLADDLGRFLDNRVVTARRTAAWERLRLWARREPRMARLLALDLALGLAAGLVLLVLYLDAEFARREAVEARRMAEQQRATAAASTARLEAAIGLMSALSSGELDEADDLGEIRALIEEVATTRPAVAADLLSQLGLHLSGRGRAAQRSEVLARAVQLARQAYGADADEVRDLLRLQGWAVHDAGDAAAAERHYRDYLAFLAARDGADSVAHAHWAPHLALALLDLDRPKEAEPIARKALTTLAREHGPDRDWTMLAAYALGRALLDQGRPAEAEPLLRQAADVYARIYSREEGIAVYSRYYLGRARLAQRNDAEARALVERSLQEMPADAAPHLAGQPLMRAWDAARGTADR